VANIQVFEDLNQSRTWRVPLTAPHRFVDPIFAIFIGTAAAAIRIRREETEKYPDQANDFESLWKKAQRMGKGYVTGYRDVKD
jgi:Non-classical export protein 1